MVKLVRLTMETNLLASKYNLNISEKPFFTHVLASVGIVSLLMFIIFHVSDSQI